MVVNACLEWQRDPFQVMQDELHLKVETVRMNQNAKVSPMRTRCEVAVSCLIVE